MTEEFFSLGRDLRLFLSEIITQDIKGSILSQSLRSGLSGGSHTPVTDSGD